MPFSCSKAMWRESCSYLDLWSLNSYQLQKAIKGVECDGIDGVIEIKGEKLLLGGTNKLTLVDLQTCQTKVIYQGLEFNCIYSFIQLDDDSILFGENIIYFK